MCGTHPAQPDSEEMESLGSRASDGGLTTRPLVQVPRRHVVPTGTPRGSPVLGVRSWSAGVGTLPGPSRVESPQSHPVPGPGLPTHPFSSLPPTLCLLPFVPVRYLPVSVLPHLPTPPLPSVDVGLLGHVKVVIRVSIGKSLYLRLWDGKRDL